MDRKDVVEDAGFLAEIENSIDIKAIEEELDYFMNGDDPN